MTHAASASSSAQHAARHAVLAQRARALQALRTTLSARGYLEVETPVCVSAPLPERYIDALSVGEGYLIPSPERDMKRLLAEGLPAIFQLTKCFRADERGARHTREFSMLEWYRAHATCDDLVADAKALICAAAQAACGSSGVIYGTHTLDCADEWEWLSVDDAYARYTTYTLPDEPDGATFDTLMATEIEPQLGISVPCVLHSYPSLFSPLARPCEFNPHRAKRCEIYCAGLEIANGCVEQDDIHILAARLREERDARCARGADPYPPPDAFLTAMASFPPAAGMALGVDRLMMFLCNTSRIDDVITFVED